MGLLAGEKGTSKSTGLLCCLASAIAATHVFKLLIFLSVQPKRKTICKKHKHAIHHSSSSSSARTHLSATRA